MSSIYDEFEDLPILLIEEIKELTKNLFENQEHK